MKTVAKENVLKALSRFASHYGLEHGFKGHRIIVNGYKEPQRVVFTPFDTSANETAFPIKLVGKRVYTKKSGATLSTFGESYKKVKIEIDETKVTVRGN